MLECKVLNRVEEREITSQIYTFTYILVIICIVGAVLILNNVSK